MEPNDYDDVVLAYRNGAPVRVRDVGHAVEGPMDTTVAAYEGNDRSVLLIVFKQPGANVIDTVDTIKARLPTLTATIPPSVKVDTIPIAPYITIRASVVDVEFTLALTDGHDWSCWCILHLRLQFLGALMILIRDGGRCRAARLPARSSICSASAWTICP